jgi:hypothetical protein
MGLDQIRRGDKQGRDLFPLCARGRARSPDQMDRFSEGNAYAQKLMITLDGYLGVAVLSILDDMEEEGESVRDYCDLLVDERKTDRRRPLGIGRALV